MNKQQLIAHRSICECVNRKGGASNERNKEVPKKIARKYSAPARLPLTANSQKRLVKNINIVYISVNIVKTFFSRNDKRIAFLHILKANYLHRNFFIIYF